ncbi:MAG: hypothetical protein E6J81_16455 [Deltaproteobacteria bacterium]|nr:MAG: hypothetical protein E6J81_16455 [Deltaproteobacteria bacterium]
MTRRAIIAVLVGILVGVAAYATIVPFDFTGHWTGTAQQEGQPANPLMADFTSTGPKTFTGTVMVDEPCTANGKAKRHMKVALRVECSNGNSVKIHGRIDPATQTMQGTFAEFRQRRLRHRGTFALSRQGGSSSATISFFSGATPAGHPAALRAVRPNTLPMDVVPKDGQWYLSPDKMILTVTSIQLQGGSMDPVAVNCSLTYDRSQPGLTKLSDCPFAATAGTYSGLNLEISPTYQVLINDSVNGFYSTSSGLVTSSPAGGAEYLTVTTNSFSGIAGEFPAPIDVSSSAPPTLSVVVNGLQFFRVQVSSGAVSLGWPDVGDTDPRRPDMTVSVNALAKVAFYSNQGINSAGAICTGGACAPPPLQGVIAAYVFYSSANVPTWIQLVLNGTPSGCPIGTSGAFNGRGYLGLDTTNTLGWALPTDNSFSSYGTEFNMAQVTMLSGSTTLNCKQISTDPAPAGGNFSSGAPVISSPDYTAGFVLVAN